MPTHDIIDNRTEKLVDHLNQMLGTSERARFAVGYLFLSGLTSVAERLLGLKELRLLIGNTTNRETVEMLAEGYRRLDLAAEEVEKQIYPKRTESGKMAQETADNLRNSVELMDQTDEAQNLIAGMIRMVDEKRLKVRVYTKGRLHAKAYICDYGKIFDLLGQEIDRHEKGIAVVGSSNLTLAGLTHNTELNVVVQGNQNHGELVHWFDDLWKEAKDFDETLMTELQASWASAQVRPYDIYMKTLYALVRDRLESEDEVELLWDDDIFRKLASFQKVAVRQAVQMVRDSGGAFVSDVVGLGKSYIGAAIVKHFERTDHARPLIICPAPLVEMWERYNEVYQLNARVLSLGFLREDEQNGVTRLLKDIKFKDRDFVLVDESHNLRHPDTQRYKIVQTFLSTGRRCCLLTATPRNKSAWDVYHQIKLFHQDDRTDLPVDPPNLKEYFKLIDKTERQLPDLLAHILVRRTRQHILRWYGFDAETHEPVDPNRFQEYLQGTRKAYVLVGGKHQFFPKRELETIEYSIEDTYQGLYQELRGYLGKGGAGGSPAKAPIRKKTGEPPTPQQFIPFDRFTEVTIRRDHLPHWQQIDATYFVTYRLADAMPQIKLDEWQREKAAWLQTHPEPHNPAEKAQFDRVLTSRQQEYLDAGHGSCVLMQPEIAAIVVDNLRHFDGGRYILDAYVVMPNHVHVLIKPLTGYDLSSILHTWKSFTSKRINAVLRRTGTTWQDESYDHIVRDEAELRHFRQYVQENSSQARRCGLIVRDGVGSGILLAKETMAEKMAGEPPAPRCLTYARYGLWHYVRAEKQKQEPYTSLQRAGVNLRGLMRVLLFKRFESSVYAFKETVKRLLKMHQTFVASLDAGFVPAGEDAQHLLYDSDILEEGDLVDALREVSKRYDAGDFDLNTLQAHLEHDIELLQKILKLVSPITPEKDAKLQTLKKRLAGKPLKGAKRLIFTQYADTAKYLFANLNPGGKNPEIEVIFSGDKSKEKVVGRFAPKANPEYCFGKDETELMMVIATDVLAEGLNLQDCDNIINYDLHWNPVRLIQRFGRIDRIGSDHERIFGFNFLPETKLDKNLGLRDKLHNRIQEIHDTIGEDSEILDQTEKLNPDAMYAIYETRGGGPVQLDLWGVLKTSSSTSTKPRNFCGSYGRTTPASMIGLPAFATGSERPGHLCNAACTCSARPGDFSSCFWSTKRAQ